MVHRGGDIASENIYIEGDNLDALKLLRETYLGKVKMIYIDPPYNTGNDFIYEDDFVEKMRTFLKQLVNMMRMVIFFLICIEIMKQMEDFIRIG